MTPPEPGKPAYEPCRRGQSRPRSRADRGPAKASETRARSGSAAKEVFESDGFLDARISDIAERAGLSHGSFYHYFESKEEVFREVAAEVDDELKRPLDSVIFDPVFTARPYERIREGIRRHLESYREEARIMGVIEQVSRFDQEVGASRFERHSKYLMEVADSIRGLQRRGLVDDRARSRHRGGRTRRDDLSVPRGVVRSGSHRLRLRRGGRPIDPALRGALGFRDESSGPSAKSPVGRQGRPGRADPSPA